MQASVGDEILVHGRHVGDVVRVGVIKEVHGDDGAPPYLVTWEDGHEVLFFPQGDASIKPMASAP